METNLVGKCGLYCGACSIFRAQRDNPRLREAIANGVKCSVDAVRCQGCGGLTTECWCYGCKILACLKKKQYDYCYQCNEFVVRSCSLYQKLADDYQEAGEDIRKNLLMIKQGKVNEWLKEQELKYSCPSCHQPISVWDEKCYHCDYQLKK